MYTTALVCVVIVALMALVAIARVRAAPVPLKGSLAYPRTLFLTYKTAGEVPLAILQRLVELHPDFEIRVYGDVECEAFLQRHWSTKHAQYFRKIPAGPIKSDFWRACVLYTFGGAYIDVDVRLARPLTDFVHADVHLCTSASIVPGRVNPIICVARPQSPILRRCVELMLSMYDKPFDYWRASICPALCQAIREHVPAMPPNANRESAIYRTSAGHKLQMLREEPWTNYRLARTTWMGKTVCMNHNPDEYDTDKHAVRKKS